MIHGEAIQCALGYAWGREDVSGQKTVGDPDRNTTQMFADAFAQGWDDYNSDARWDMIPVRDAYERWQATGGQSIFPEGRSTAEMQALSEENRRSRSGKW